MRDCGADFLQRLYPEARPTDFLAADYLQGVEQWQRVFAAPLHWQTGEWQHGGHDWHVFSYGFTPALVGAPAEKAYTLHLKSPVWVFVDAPRHGLCYAAKHAPALRDIRHAAHEFFDIYIMEAERRWTFVWTHEVKWELGPYFAEAPKHRR